MLFAVQLSSKRVLWLSSLRFPSPSLPERALPAAQEQVSAPGDGPENAPALWNPGSELHHATQQLGSGSGGWG